MKNIVKLETGKDLLITSHSSRELILQHHILSEVKLQTNKKNEIVSLSVDDFEIKKGTILNIKLFNNNVVPFKVLHIIKSKCNSYSLLSTKITKATRFIMPMLRIKDESYQNMKYKTHLINCYVGTKEEGYMPEIHLVYRFSGTKEYKIFEEKLQSHELFDRMTDIDKYHVMYTFSMTKDQMKIFELFKNGKYSKFPNDYKTKVLNFVIDHSEHMTEDYIRKTVTYGALYKSVLQKQRIENLIKQPLPKDLEYFSIPIEDEEVYDGSIEIVKFSELEIDKKTI
jgi:hypothetical protein